MKSWRRRLHLALRTLAGHDAETFAPHGIPVHVPRSVDLNARYFLARGRPYEEAEARLVRRHLAHGMHVVELGGCMGIISAVIRERIGPDARHVVVEAMPALAAICARNAAIGASPGASEVVAAAIDYSGAPSVRFATGHSVHVGRVADAVDEVRHGAGNAAGAGMVREVARRSGHDADRDSRRDPSNEARSGTVVVPTTTLSALLGRIPDGPFALVCDVEGAEIALVEHEAEALSRVSVLVLETHPDFYRGGAADLADMIGRLRASGLEEVESDGQVRCFVRAPR